MTRPEGQLRLEDQLRDAFQAAAQTVAPGTVPPLPGHADLARRAGSSPLPGPGLGLEPAERTGAGRLTAFRTRPGRRIAGPVSAAAGIAAVMLVVTVAAPRLVGGGAGGTARPAAAGAGGAPRYYAAVQSPSATTVRGATALQILSTATGRVTGQVPPPSDGLDFQVVAAVRSDHSFVAAAEPAAGAGRACVSWLYRFDLTAQGQPVHMRRLLAVAGIVPLNQLAVSRDGRVIAYARTGCGANAAGSGHGQVVVARAGRHGFARRAWQESPGRVPLRVMLSGDGRELSVFAAQKTDGPLALGAWAMPSSAASGSLNTRLRPVSSGVQELAAAQNPARNAIVFVSGDIFSPPGRMFVLVRAVSPEGRHGGSMSIIPPLVQVRARHGEATLTTPGAFIDIPLRGGGFEGLPTAWGLVVDSSGQHALLYGLQQRSEYLNLATDALTGVPRPAVSARVWSAAW